MFKIDKKDLKNNDGVAIGTIFVLSGSIGYGSEVVELDKLKEVVSEIEASYGSDNILFDVRNLEEWHSIALRIIFPKIEDLNEKLISIKKMPIGFLGDTELDVFDAAKERYKINGTDQLPWFQSIEEYLVAVD